jgi:hypothetical protein
MAILIRRPHTTATETAPERLRGDVYWRSRLCALRVWRVTLAPTSCAGSQYRTCMTRCRNMIEFLQRLLINEKIEGRAWSKATDFPPREQKHFFQYVHQ